MQHLRGLVLFLFFLPGGARRSVRIGDSRGDAQRQENTLSNRFEVSAKAREAFIPMDYAVRTFRGAGPRAGALREGSRPYGRRAGHLEPHRSAPLFRFGQHRAKVALQAASGPEEDQLPPKDNMASSTTQADTLEYDGALDSACQSLEDALRRFRMLHAPYTAMVKNAKQQVQALAAELDAPKQKFVEGWMEKVERGQTAADPSEVLDRPELAGALRGYGTAAGLWSQAGERLCDARRCKPGVVTRFDVLHRLALACALSINGAMLPLPAHGSADTVAGSAVFELKCAACHAQGGNALNPLKTLKASKLDNEQIKAIVSDGKGQMPSYGPKAPPFARLTEEEIADVAAYLEQQNAAGWPQ